MLTNRDRQQKPMHVISNWDLLKCWERKWRLPRNFCTTCLLMRGIPPHCSGGLEMEWKMTPRPTLWRSSLAVTTLHAGPAEDSCSLIRIVLLPVRLTRMQGYVGSNCYWHQLNLRAVGTFCHCRLWFSASGFKPALSLSHKLSFALRSICWSGNIQKPAWPSWSTKQYCWSQPMYFKR